MKNIFKSKIEQIDYTNYNETGKLSDEINNSNLSLEDKIELLEMITDRKIEAESNSIMNFQQLFEKLDNEGEFDYEN